MKTILIGLDTAEIRALTREEGEPLYRGTQIAEWIYHHGAKTFDDMSNLPATLREKFAQKFEVGRSKIVTTRHDKDGTMKLLLEMSDGARIETVGLPYADRFSCCLSTQAGCPVGCAFCASGQGSFVRNLSPGEIVEQALSVQELAQSGTIQFNGPGQRIDHVTIMGMGEPLLNYESTLKAVRLLNKEIGIGMRHITVSTVGFVPGILDLAGEKMQITLAISLHAPNDELRKKLIPGMAKWSIAEIINASRKYIRQTGRRITFEYCMINGLNDRDIEARELAQLLTGLNCHVNLIRYNPVPGLPFRAPLQARVQAFRDVLQGAGIQVTQRFQRGAGINAACGQLRRQMENTRK
ncbi:23S rRNA (adenine(2503)-C(2))-methyltransferase RlmN [Chloroflexota bacterium]